MILFIRSILGMTTKIFRTTKEKNGIRKHRINFRNSIRESGAKPAYSNDQYKKRISAHRDTLDKYMSQFGGYFKYFAPPKSRNYKKLSKLLGVKRFDEIESGKPPTINEVYEIFCAFDFKRPFSNYLLNKTHFSYSIYNQKLAPAADNDLWLKRKHPGYIKFAEFVYVILSEYIVLHNYMWSSGLKPKGSKTIDRFMRTM